MTPDRLQLKPLQADAMERIVPRKTRIGLVAGGLGAYWPQFPNLLPQLQQSGPPGQ